MSDLKGRIAVIGWGSLIWDLDDLAPKVAGDWLIGAGPVMPFEFSRISPKRKQALAVCIDPVNGDECPTSVIASVRRNISDAADDLQARERAQQIEFIGFYCAQSGAMRSRIPEVGPRVQDWCAAIGAIGAVWTDLDSNFEARQGISFSLPEGIAYLRGLEGDSLEEAVRYITFAPSTTNTKLRKALEREDWWREARARFC